MKLLLISITLALLISSSVMGQNIIQQGRDLSKAKKFKEALPLLQQAVQQFPDSDRAYNYRANSELGLGDTTNALKDYDKAISLNPGVYYYYSNRGSLKDNLKDTKAALENYNKALEICKTDATLYNSIGYVQHEMGNDEDAVKNYEKSIELNKDSTYSLPYMNLGIIYYLRGKYSESIKLYSIAIKRDTAYEHAYYNRGLAYDLTDLHAEALKDFKRAIKIDSTDLLSYKFEAADDARLHDKKTAVADYEKAIKVKPGIETYTMLAEFYYHTKDYTNAEDTYTRLIKLMPKSGAAYFARGKIYMAAAKKPESCSDFNMAVKLGCNDAKAMLLFCN